MERLFRPYVATLLLGGLLATSACKEKVDPEPEHEQELITTVVLRLEPVDKGQQVTVTYRDLDGPGGQAPVIDNLVLKPNTVYNASLSFLDESMPSHAHDITEEIREEGSEHEVFYVVTGGANISFAKTVQTDMDANNRPIGLETVATTAAASTGAVRIVLKHQPGLKSASSTIETGETDVDITFPTVIQE